MWVRASCFESIWDPLDASTTKDSENDYEYKCSISIKEHKGHDIIYS